MLINQVLILIQPLYSPDDEIMPIYDEYMARFPDHPGFNVLFLQPGSPVAEIALAQMMDCLEGDRTEPVTDESIGNSLDPDVLI